VNPQTQVELLSLRNRLKVLSRPGVAVNSASVPGFSDARSPTSRALHNNVLERTVAMLFLRRVVRSLGCWWQRGLISADSMVVPGIWHRGTFSLPTFLFFDNDSVIANDRLDWDATLGTELHRTQPLGWTKSRVARVNDARHVCRASVSWPAAKIGMSFAARLAYCVEAFLAFWGSRNNRSLLYT